MNTGVRQSRNQRGLAGGGGKRRKVGGGYDERMEISLCSTIKTTDKENLHSFFVFDMAIHCPVLCVYSCVSTCVYSSK